MNEKVKSLLASLIVVLISLPALAACTGREEPPLQGARLGGPFTLTAHDGRTVSDRDFNGRYRLIYFGYSYCPDVCPTDLATIGQGLSQFEKKDPGRASKIQPLFFSVDPERDTPATLAKYVSAFHPRLIGLTGTAEQVAATAKLYGIVYSKQQSPAGASQYLMDHSRQAMLFGPEGQPIALIPQDEGAKAVAAELDRWVE
jgi:protein SCO1